MGGVLGGLGRLLGRLRRLLVVSWGVLGQSGGGLGGVLGGLGRQQRKKGRGIYLFSIFGVLFGVQNGVKITKNLSEMRSENENGDFAKTVFPCTREHDF